MLRIIPDPDFYPSRIPDPKTATKERGEKKLVVILFYVATNFTKLKIILVLKCRRKKFGPIFKELFNFLPQKLPQSYQKYGFGIRDPGYEIRDPEKTYSGSRGQKGTGSRIRIRNTRKNIVKWHFWVKEVVFSPYFPTCVRIRIKM